MLAETNNGEIVVLEMRKNEIDAFSSIDWTNRSISNVSNLILIDCVEILETFGQTSLRYQVYASVNDELVLIN